MFDYDKVVIATHADEALELIENPTEDEKNILSSFSYKENTAYIHTDTRDGNAGVVESTKAASDVYTPVSGEVVDTRKKTFLKKGKNFREFF